MCTSRIHKITAKVDIFKFTIRIWLNIVQDFQYSVLNDIYLDAIFQAVCCHLFTDNHNYSYVEYDNGRRRSWSIALYSRHTIRLFIVYLAKLLYVSDQLVQTRSSLSLAAKLERCTLFFVEAHLTKRIESKAQKWKRPSIQTIRHNEWIEKKSDNFDVTIVKTDKRELKCCSVSVILKLGKTFVSYSSRRWSFARRSACSSIHRHSSCIHSCSRSLEVRIN